MWSSNQTFFFSRPSARCRPARPGNPLSAVSLEKNNPSKFGTAKLASPGTSARHHPRRRRRHLVFESRAKFLASRRWPRGRHTHTLRRAMIKTRDDDLLGFGGPLCWWKGTEDLIGRESVDDGRWRHDY